MKEIAGGLALWLSELIDDDFTVLDYSYYRDDRSMIDLQIYHQQFKSAWIVLLVIQRDTIQVTGCFRGQLELPLSDPACLDTLEPLVTSTIKRWRDERLQLQTARWDGKPGDWSNRMSWADS